MTHDRYRAAKEVFLEVCDLLAEARKTAVDEACGDDADLRADVESLLRHHAVGPGPGLEPGDETQTPPETIGRYRVLHEIGRGGMGIVYAGVREDAQIKHDVAIKVLKRGMDTEQILGRFALERDLLSALNHPGIARLYEGGETEAGVPYFAMERIDGVDIATYCDRNRLPIERRLELFCKVCAAVHYAHQNLVVHRDLKPGNIVVTADGEPKLLDFGIAKLVNPGLTPAVNAMHVTEPEFRVMTPQYASPEQVRGSTITTASDVYSLGVILYELVSGHRPYRLKSRVRAEIERVVCEEDPEKPSTAISRVEPAPAEPITPERVGHARDETRPERLRRRLEGDIDNIVFMAMRKDPPRRYVSAEQLAEDLRRHLTGLPVIARPDTFGYRLTKFVQRNRAGVAVAAIILLLIIGGIAGTSTGMLRAQRDRDALQRAQSQLQGVLSANMDTVDAFLTSFDSAFAQVRGSTTARTLLHSAALDNLNRIRGAVGDTPELLQRVAAAHEAVGNAFGGVRDPSLGDTTAARSHYERAIDLRLLLAAETPGDANLKHELFKSHTRLGDMLRRSNDSGGALRAHRSALARAEEYLATDSMAARARRDVSIALLNVGAQLIATGDVEAGVDHYQRSLELREALVENDPANVRFLRDLSVAQLRIAHHLEATDVREAERLYRRCETVRSELVALEPESRRYRRDLTVVQYALIGLLTSEGRGDEALDLAGPYLSAVQELVADDAADQRMRRDEAAAHELLGSLYDSLERWDEAFRHYSAVEPAVEPLLEIDAGNVDCRLLLVGAEEGLCATASARGDRAAALAHARRALEIIASLADADPENEKLATHRARVRGTLETLTNRD